MLTRTKLFSASLALALLASVGAICLAQQPQNQTQQIQKIREANFESTKTQREELQQLMQKRFQGTLTAEEQARAKTLHEQVQASMKDTESKIAAIRSEEHTSE